MIIEKFSDEKYPSYHTPKVSSPNFLNSVLLATSPYFVVHGLLYFSFLRVYLQSMITYYLTISIHVEFIQFLINVAFLITCCEYKLHKYGSN